MTGTLKKIKTEKNQDPKEEKSKPCQIFLLKGVLVECYESKIVMISVRDGEMLCDIDLNQKCLVFNSDHKMGIVMCASRVSCHTVCVKTYEHKFKTFEDAMPVSISIQKTKDFEKRWLTAFDESLLIDEDRTVFVQRLDTPRVSKKIFFIRNYEIDHSFNFDETFKFKSTQCENEDEKRKLEYSNFISKKALNVCRTCFGGTIAWLLEPNSVVITENLERNTEEGHSSFKFLDSMSILQSDNDKEKDKDNVSTEIKMSLDGRYTAHRLGENFYICDFVGSRNYRIDNCSCLFAFDEQSELIVIYNAGEYEFIRLANSSICRLILCARKFEVGSLFYGMDRFLLRYILNFADCYTQFPITFKKASDLQ